MALLISVFSGLLCLVSLPLISGVHEKGLRVTPVLEWNLLYIDAPENQTRTVGGQAVFNPNRTYISGLEVADDRFFFALPQTFTVVRATLTSVSRSSRNSAPLLQPYPNINWFTLNLTQNGKPSSSQCERNLVSVFGMERDACNRLWVLDSGGVYYGQPNQKRICPAKIVIFQLPTDQLIKVVNIPDNLLTSTSILVKIVLEDASVISGNKTGNCDSMFAYMADTGGSAVIVYNSIKNTFHKISHPTMKPNPAYKQIKIDGELIDQGGGVHGMDVVNVGSQSYLFYTPLSSTKVYSVPTSTLQLGPVSDPSKLDVREEFSKPSQGMALLADRATSKILVNPITFHTIQEYNPSSRKLRSLIYDDDNIKVVHDMKNDNANNKILYAISDRGQKVANGNIDPSVINFKLLQLQ